MTERTGRWFQRVIGLGLSIGIGGCGGCRTPSAVADASPVSGLVDAADAGPSLAARCTETKSLALEGRKNLEIGEAVSGPSSTAGLEAVAIGVAHDGSGARRGSVLLTDTALASEPTVLDFGPLPPDAPPPKPILLEAKRVVVAGYAKATPGARTLDVLVNQHDELRMSFTEKADDSFAFDAAIAPGSADGALAWDEAEGTRGVIKVAPFAAAARPAEAGAGRVVSPPTSDAEFPRLALRPGGFWLAWIAHAPEPERDASAVELEGPGEKRRFSYVEVMPLDSQGAPAGTAHRLRAVRYVEGFDVGAREGGAALDVLVKDDESPRDDAGARLVLVTLRGETEQIRALVPDGVGRGIPDLVGSWAAFTDRQDRARLVGLDPAGRQSIDPALDGARVLAPVLAPVLGSVGPGILAGYPSDPRKTLRLLGCGKQ